MNYTKLFINELSNKTNYIGYNLEKMVRLLNILEFIFSKSSFANDVVLKGGTAINLVHTDLKRLSVDIDLDYQGSLDKNKAASDRENIISELDKFMTNEGYSVSFKSRNSVALLSRLYRYNNAFGNIDYIKVEINFMDRISIYPPSNCVVNQFNKTIQVKIPAKEELYAMKICALIDRSKPRDLFDVDYLFHNFKDIDITKLRKCIIFYLSLNNIFEINDSSYKGIKSIKQSFIKKELQPVLAKNEKFDSNKSISFVVDRLIELIELAEQEKQYLIEFSKGNYNPSLLFEGQESIRAAQHPMAKWRILNINKN